MTETQVLKKRIKEIAEGAALAKKSISEANKFLAQEIKEMAAKGKITLSQATNLTVRVLKMDPLSEASISNFVDYVANLFSNAESRNIIEKLRKALPKAKKNVASKIGIADTLRGPLNKLLSINPSLIPDTYLKRYSELIDMLSANEQVLTLEQYDVVKSDTEAILRAINEEQSKAYDLADILENSENRVVIDGKLNYAATLKKMVEEGEITEKEANIMRKYKKEIMPQEENQKMSEEEIKEKKKEEIEALKKSKITGIDQLPSQEERTFAEEFAELIKNISASDLMKLQLSDLRNLKKVIDNINKNYLPSYAYQVYQKIDGIRDGKALEDAATNATPPKVSTAIAKIKNLITNRGALLEAIKRIPLFNIDQVLGNFKGKEVFNALLLKTAQAEAKYKAELKKINSLLEKAETNVAKSFLFDGNEIALSKMKMMTYMIQLEYESNIGNAQVNPAIDYIKRTIEHIEDGQTSKRYGEADVKNLKFILEKFEKDGQINLKELFDSFNKAEKDAISDVRKINESLRSKAEFTSNIIRGDVFDGLNNYVHLNVLNDGPEGDIDAATDVMSRANNAMTPSTRAKSLITRTKGVKPLNFDIFTSASRGTKFVLLDYHLTRPIKTARIALNQLAKNLKERKNVTKLQKEVANALTEAYRQAVNNLLVRDIMEDTAADQIISYIGRAGYRSVLAGTGRFAAELASNISFAVLAEPQAFLTGTKLAKIIMSPIGPLVLQNTSSTQTNRIFPEDSLSGNFMDSSVMNQRVGIGSKVKNKALNKIEQTWNFTGKKLKNGIEVLADNMISTPDKIVMRSLWFGSFANEFKKASGRNVDFELIGENNEKYLKDNKDAIAQARAAADLTSVQAGATDNSFMGILKGVSRPNQTLLTKVYNNFNSYMTRFLIFEYMSSRTAVYAMMGDGMISRSKGAMLLAAVATRMTLYTLLSRAFADGIIGLAAPLFGIEDEEEEEEEKSFLQSVSQAIVGTVTSLLFGRDFGNTVKLAINYGLEEFNEEFLDFLRDGEYDQYDDAIAYSLIPRGKEDKTTLGDFAFRLGGSFGPSLQTGSLVFDNLMSGSIQAVLSGDTTKKEADAIERERRVVTQRIPLEILGNAGFIPLYKDVRRAANKSIYADLRDKKSNTADPKAVSEKFDKLKDLNELKKKTKDSGERRAIDQKILEIVGSEEAKASVDQQKGALTARKKRLLYDSSKGKRYDNESDMKRLNPSLWRKRFGPNSDWDKDTRAKDAVESKLGKIETKREDKEFRKR